jgi:glutamate synthase (NADPH/NADH) small chain
VLRRGELLAEAGVVFKTGFEVGREASLDALRKRHDALLIATGVYKARELLAPGSGAGNIVAALDYLIASNRKGLGDRVPDFESGALDAAGKHVVVVGGGDTAMDCVRTAIRQGAKSVKCLYRRDRANMPGSQREVANAEEEGVEFLWQSLPQAFLDSPGDSSRADSNRGKVRAVRAIRVHLGPADATGRQVPSPIEGSEFDVEADLVVKALGFDAEALPTLFDAPALAVTAAGTIKVDWRSLMTAIPGVFAAGDIVRGASLVVWGIRDGRDAAASIDRYLSSATRRAAAE